MPRETFNQIDQQLAANEQQGAAVLVEQGDDKIAVGQVLATPGENGARVFFNGSNDEVSERAIPTKLVSAEKLSDSHQELLAEKLAGAALRGADVPVVKEHFNPEVANLEKSIKEAENEKRRAQKEGRGEDSIYWGQVAGQYAKELRDKRK